MADIDGLKARGPRIGDVMSAPPARKKSKPKNRKRSEGYHTEIDLAAKRQVDQLMSFRPAPGAVYEDVRASQKGNVDLNPFSGSKTQKRRKRSSSKKTSDVDVDEILPGLEEAMTETFISAYLDSTFGMNDTTLLRGLSGGDTPDLSGLL